MFDIGVCKRYNGVKVVLGGELGLPCTRNARYAGLNSRPRFRAG